MPLIQKQIHKDQNSASDKLAVSASTLQPSDEMLKGDCPLEINFRPSIPDNLEHWQVFQDDAQILKFINHLDEFSNYKASEREEGKEYKDEGNRFNPVTRGFVALENIFDRQDRRKNNVEQMKPDDYIEINIGTETEPKIIKIGKNTSEKERNSLINLVKEYRDVFSFTYDELKAYRENVFQHTIPLKPEFQKVSLSDKNLGK